MWQENGHLAGSSNHESSDGYKLGVWVTVQRSKWETLSEDRKQRLRAASRVDARCSRRPVGGGVSIIFRSTSTEHGDARVRDDYVADDGYKLGKWVGKQRTKWESLTEDRRQRLLELPGWILDDREACGSRGSAF